MITNANVKNMNAAQKSSRLAKDIAQHIPIMSPAKANPVLDVLSSAIPKAFET